MLAITGTPFVLGYSHEEVCCGGDRHERVVGKAEKSVKEKTDSLDKEKRKGSSQGSGTMGWRKRTAIST